MMTATGTRAEARKNLQGKWGKGALISFCYVLVETILRLISDGVKDNSSLSLAFNIISIIISVPLTYGLIVSFMKLKRDEQVGGFDFLKLGFSSFSRAWKIQLNMLLKMIIPIILLVISIILFVTNSVVLVFNNSDTILNYAQQSRLYNDYYETLDDAQTNYYRNPSSENYQALQNAKQNLESFRDSNSSVASTNKNNSLKHSSSNVGLFIVSIILFFVSGIYSYIKSLSLALSMNIGYDEQNLTAKESCEKSQSLMKGNKGNYFVLTLSFIGWAILAVLTLGIGFLWLTPYILVSQVCFYEELSGRKDNNINDIEKAETI